MRGVIGILFYFISVASSTSSEVLRHAFPSPRIILGTSLQGFSHSFYCTLYVDFASDSGTRLCGCVIIGSETILTAAHCFEKLDPVDGVSVEYFSAARVLLYGDSRKADKLLRVQRPNIVVHPEHSVFTLKNDIAYLKISQVQSGSQLIIIYEASAWDSLSSHDKLTVIGVGENERDDIAFSLGPPQMTHLSRRDCETPEGYGYFSGWTYAAHLGDICAGPFYACTEERCGDSCRGDSGGPLVFESNGTITLFGIVSRGDYLCGTKGGRPGIYTPSHRHEQFIKQSILSSVTNDEYFIRTSRRASGSHTLSARLFYPFFVFVIWIASEL